MKSICKSCFHCNGIQESAELLPEYTTCELSNVLHRNMLSCVNHNRDLSNQRICFNCANYLGGMDWGLSCKDSYYRLCSALDVACDKYISKT